MAMPRLVVVALLVTAGLMMCDNGGTGGVGGGGSDMPSSRRPDSVDVQAELILSLRRGDKTTSSGKEWIFSRQSGVYAGGACLRSKVKCNCTPCTVRHMS